MASNWNPAAAPNTSGAVADFTGVDLTADAIVTLDSDRTVGSLTFGDTDPATAAGWTVAGSTATPASNFIIFQTTTGPATINVGALAVGKQASITAKIKTTASQEIVKTGSGTLFLGYGTGTGVSQADNFLGVLTLQQGTVAFNNAFQLGVFAADRMVFNGGTLAWTGVGGFASGRLFTLGAGGGQIENNGGGAVNLSGTAAMTLTGNGARSLTFGGSYVSAANTFASAINDGPGGATSVVKVGAGAWNLTNASNGFTGNITISGGTLQATTLGGGMVSIAQNATFVLSRTTGLTSAVAVTGAGNFAVSVGNNQLNLSNATFSGTTNIQSGTYHNNNARSSNFVLGAAGLNVATYGVLGLTDADFTGPLGTTGGGVTWLSSGGFSAVGAGTRVVNIGGNATPDTLTQGVGGFYLGSNSSIDSRLKFGDTSGTSLGTIDFKNNVILNGRAFKAVVDGANNGIGLIVSGDLSGTGRSDGTKDALVKFGNASLKLAGNNTYSGATTVGGTQAIILGSPGALSPSTNVILSGGNVGTNGGVLGLGDGDLAINLGMGPRELSWGSGMSGGFAAYGANRTITLAGGATLNWGSTASFVGGGQNIVLSLPSADATITLANAIDLSGGVRTLVVNDGSAAIDARLTQSISGTTGSSLIKSGAGTLLMSGVSNYAGATTISSGTLLLTGSTNSATTAATGTIVGGTGSFGDNLSVNGTLAPGLGVGSLEVGGNLAFTASAAFAVELAGAGFSLNTVEEYDRVKLFGATPTLSLANAALAVSLTNGFALTDGIAFGIAQLSDGATLSGNFSGLTTDGSLVGTYGGVPLYITYSGNVSDGGVIATSGGNDIVLYTVPEPTSLAGLVLSTLMACVRRRRAEPVR